MRKTFRIGNTIFSFGLDAPQLAAERVHYEGSVGGMSKDTVLKYIEKQKQNE